MSTTQVWVQSPEQKRENDAAAKVRSRAARHTIPAETLAALGVYGMRRVEDHTVPHPKSEGKPKGARSQPSSMEKPIAEGREPKRSWRYYVKVYMTSRKPSLADIVDEFARPRVMHGG